MYKAVHAQTGEEIIILQPAWRKRIAELRALDRADLLVCQGCRQPLRVKAGAHKRTHFAHKHLLACSYGSESPRMLNARAVLYERLALRFGPRLTVEKLLPDSGLPRPVDCWVEAEPAPIAYWIVESGIRLEPREAIRAAFTRLGVKVHYIFLANMLNEEKKAYDSLLLTPTERAFLRSTAYDEILSGMGDAGGTLHYLDVERAILTTFRGLTLFHRPNWFKGLKKTSPLAAVGIHAQDGELVHAGETERLGTLRHKQQRRATKREQYQQRAADWAQRLSAATQTDTPAATDVPATPVAPEPESKARVKLPLELPCATCGQLTTDYWATFFDASGRQLCRCRECLERDETNPGR